MRIAIDVNGVLRDTIGKITQVYQKNFLRDQEDLHEQETFILNESGDTELNITKDIFKYEMNIPVTSYDLKNHFKFKSDEELYSFLYEEFAMEIFGHAGSTELSSMNDFNDFYLENRKNNEIIIISDEIGKSKPATLFFLSKFGCLVEKIKFFSNSTIKSMWNEIDILLTSNPELLLNYPKNKILIKFETSYNNDIKSEFTINSLKELNQTIKNLNF
jgi:hypothetical protein